MKRQWLLFSQVVTVLVAIWFVVMTLKPEWVNSQRSPTFNGVTLLEAAPNVSGAPMPGSLSPAAKVATRFEAMAGSSPFCAPVERT